MIEKVHMENEGCFRAQPPPPGAYFRQSKVGLDDLAAP